jgi:hypothetical protein
MARVGAVRGLVHRIFTERMKNIKKEHIKTLLIPMKPK